MKDIPIIFSAPMVRAILEGRKTVTRRTGKDWFTRCERFQAGERYRLYVRETFVLESDYEYTDFAPLPTDRPVKRVDGGPEWGEWNLIPHYRATEPEPHIVPNNLEDESDDRTRWTPAIHMPKWASRIFAPVLDMRVERLQDISEDDAAAEGVVLGPPGSRPDWGWIGAPGLPDRVHASEAFRDLWDHINGPGSWEANPEVVRIEFKPEVKR